MPGRAGEDSILRQSPGTRRTRKMDLFSKRILIVKPSSLGDVVHTLPLVHALKRNYPSCSIGWIVQKGFQAIIESDPAIDEIIPISIPSTSDPQAPRGAFISAASATMATLRNLRKRFKDRPYDLVLDLHASFRSGLLALANPGGLRIGFRDAKELNTLFQHRLVGSNPDKRHAVDKNSSFADYLGCSTLPEDYRIVVSPKARERIKRVSPRIRRGRRRPTCIRKSRGALGDQILDCGRMGRTGRSSNPACRCCRGLCGEPRRTHRTYERFRSR